MIRAVPCKRILAGVLLLALLPAASAGFASVEVIALRYRRPSEVLPLVKPLLTTQGKISADDRTNQLIIVDSEEAIERVRQTLGVLDRQAPQASIRVRFQETGDREDRSIAGGGRASGDRWSVSAGRGRRGGEGVDWRLQDRSISRSGDSEYFINVLSGGWAYIRVGQDVPISTYWVDLCRRYGHTMVYRRIETGFDVKPLIRETMAEVEIVPRISEMGSDGRGDAVRFAEAATRTIVPLGQWIVIGGSDQSASEVVRAILEAGGSRQSSASRIHLMIEGR